MPRSLRSASLSLLLTAACSAGATSPDARDAIALAAGKGDAGYTGCELSAVVTWVNDVSVTGDTLIEAGVHTRAARNIARARDGQDQVAGTADDVPFADIEAVDDVYFVGPVALEQLVAAVAHLCVAETGPAEASVEVLFSPQPYDSSHLARAIDVIDHATRSVDVAMYSFRDANLEAALDNAAHAGVNVRVILDGAREDRIDPAGTLSARLEDNGIEVRWVNKVMHHKFVIADGVHQAGDDPADAVIMTGSGNWSYSAATRYDENTLVIHHAPELAVEFQAEFELLWNNSRPVIWNESIAPVTVDAVATESVTDDPSTEALFTSANFRTYVSSRYGPTFSHQRGQRHVAEALADMIEGADESVLVASGHLRSRLVSEALVQLAETKPHVDIRVLLDGQEWISAGYHGQQENELEACLAAAGTDENDIEDCTYGGTYFSYALAEAGVPLRFKYYAYRWDYTYADQMHHKFMVVDGDELATGSYNLSDNAETNTMENVVILRGDAHAQVIDAYVDEFDRLWTLEEQRFESFLAEVTGGSGALAIVFDSMSLTWAQVDTVKNAIRAACPAVDSLAFRSDPSGHQVCFR